MAPPRPPPQGGWEGKTWKFGGDTPPHTTIPSCLRHLPKFESVAAPLVLCCQNTAEVTGVCLVRCACLRRS